ncbi:branched-chain amino acid ABC transporter permease [Variovorax ginsengisoli]|uniref:Branched-chain amino acid ABC transporter permease n=1 Tax=Variovorax ginsengisoli TaxID=363844 RepID=A0ABT8S9M4_9BURK|nr:branched-chain amino acid ABC transporter permease [Variovorax ginsengisoli]MDN8616433.1 branched-chain amino acid ABC transporter permease [Variovorax ginsengisoli]MDO1535603.1 branched-chain amino acid ABC transporter permease [Variovorax ginsengisoli]
MNQTSILQSPASDSLQIERQKAFAQYKVQQWVLVGLAVALMIAPALLYPVFLMKVLCFALFALSFNLLLGFGGMLSFGHAAYFGGGSYAVAYLATQWGAPPELSLLAAVSISTVMGAAFGAIAVRRDGIYFAMITLALAQLVYFIAVRNSDLTGGENGIQAVPRGRLFGLLDLSNDMVLYAVVAVLFIATLALVIRIVHSPFGQTCRAIRDNEARAISLGYRVTRYKILLFTLSAAVAGLAGGMKALVFQLATLADVHWTLSSEVILMTLLGGLGTLFGPVAGALIVVTLQNFLAGLGEWVTVIQGVIFAICVMAFRAGIVGTIAKRSRQEL